MLIKKYLFIAAVSVWLFACSAGGEGGESELPKPPGPAQPTERMPIDIITSITRATETAFEDGDKIGLFVVNRNADGSAVPLKPSGNYVDNMLYTYATSWNPASALYWKDAETHADFYMYYPYTSTITSVDAMPFKVNADQSSEAAFKASDLIVGSTLDVVPTASPVNIMAKHIMSQVAIVLKAGAGFTESSLAASNPSVRINNLVTSSTVNLSTSEVTMNGTASNVIPYKDGNVYRAIVVPQTVTDTQLITVTIDGYEYKLSQNITFVSGKRHTINVTVKKISNGVNVTIEGWEDDDVDYGGIAS